MRPHRWPQSQRQPPDPRLHSAKSSTKHRRCLSLLATIKRLRWLMIPRRAPLSPRQRHHHLPRPPPTGSCRLPITYVFEWKCKKSKEQSRVSRQIRHVSPGFFFRTFSSIAPLRKACLRLHFQFTHILAHTGRQGVAPRPPPRICRRVLAAGSRLAVVLLLVVVVLVFAANRTRQSQQRYS